MISQYTLENILRFVNIDYSGRDGEGKRDRAIEGKRSGDSGFEVLWLGDNKVLKYHVVILKLSTNILYYCNNN